MSTEVPFTPAPDDHALMVELGAALAVLRARASFSQAEAGAAFGTTGQAWAKYENGRASAIFKPSVQDRLAKAVGASRRDLLEEVERRRSREPRPADEDWTPGGRFLEVEDAR
jgi:transcriptional regulator with XRE-family HTH domain